MRTEGEPIIHLGGGEPESLAPDEAVQAGIDLLHLTGRHTLVLTPKERAALEEYVRAGGTLLVDAFCGAPTFAASARRELEEVFGELKPLSPNADSLVHSFPHYAVSTWLWGTMGSGFRGSQKGSREGAR